jgi:copper(I)-binding protein
MRFSALAVISFAFVAACAAQGAPAGARIDVRNAWIRTPPPGAPTAAGYVTLTNRAIASDRLTGAYTGVAASVGLHDMQKTGGVMRMRPMPGGIAIGSSATVSLGPNGRHLMLTGLKHPLRAGEHVRIVLQFQRAGDVPTDFVVRN